MRLSLRLGGFAWCTVLLGTALSARAETLQGALIKAYNTNPTLSAQRNTLKAADEGVPIARSDGLPSLSGSTGYTENVKRDLNVRNNFSDPLRQVSAQASLSVPILTFGSVGGAVRAAKSTVLATRMDLRGAESDVFTAVVGAYMDVLTDEAIVGLNQDNVDILAFYVRASQENFRVGTGTGTDVDQATARLALGRSQLQTARARLIVSRENYVRLVGDAPIDLEPPPPEPDLPTDVDSAVAIALGENAKLLSAKRKSEASRAQVDVAKAEVLPRLNGVADASYYNYLDSLNSTIFGTANQTGKSASVGVSLRIPIYQGGKPSADERQAKDRYGAALEQVTEVERSVIADTRGDFALWQAAREVIVSAEEGVRANRRSLEDVRTANSAGVQSLLDVLNAQQELINSQITLLTAHHDEYVAAFALLASMGRAEASSLGLEAGTPLYDPLAHYKRSVHSIFDYDTTPMPKPQAPSTADVPAQTADVRHTKEPLLQIPPAAP